MMQCITAGAWYMHLRADTLLGKYNYYAIYSFIIRCSIFSTILVKNPNFFNIWSFSQKNLLILSIIIFFKFSTSIFVLT